MEEHLLLGIMRIQEAKDIQAKLKKEGIETNLVSNPQTCTTGSCAVTVELWGDQKDLVFFQNYFSDEMKKNLAGHEVDIEAFNQVFDPNAKEVICQACGAKFSPTANECPDCGLVY